MNPVPLPEDLDEAFAVFERLVQAYEGAQAKCDAEHAAGRTGLVAYTRAAALYQQVKQCAATLLPRIDEARRSL